MNCLIVYAAIGVILTIVHCEDAKSKFDSVDVDVLIQNERLLKNHFACIIDGKGCTPETDEMRKKIPEILDTCCAKCSDKQKENGIKLIKHVAKNKPEYLKQFFEKYDSDKKSREKCADKMKDWDIDFSKF